VYEYMRSDALSMITCLSKYYWRFKDEAPASDIPSSVSLTFRDQVVFCGCIYAGIRMCT